MESDIITLTAEQLVFWGDSYELKTKSNGFKRLEDAGLDYENFIHINKYTYKIIDKQKYLLAKIEYGI